MTRDTSVSKMHNLEFNYDGSANVSGEKFLSSPSRPLRLRCPLILKSNRYHSFFLQKLPSLEFHRALFPVHRYIFRYMLMSVWVYLQLQLLSTLTSTTSPFTLRFLFGPEKRDCIFFSLFAVHVPLVTTLLGPIKCILFILGILERFKTNI